jgi:DNA-binding MarR family transcriptional regulator
MIAEHVDFEAPYKQLERAAVAVLEGADREAALRWLDELEEHIDRVIGDSDLDGVSNWSARLDRLAANFGDRPIAALAVGYLSAMLHRLDRSAASLAQQHDVQEREKAAVGVRERVLAFVAERPRSRSGEIADSLMIAPSQASRALRELRSRGQVVLAEPSPNDPDKRVHRYIAAGSAGQAHAA